MLFLRGFEFLVGVEVFALGLGSPVAGSAPFSAEVALPSTARRVSVQAVDEAGNIGPQATVKVP